MQDFKKLKAWEMAHAFVIGIKGTIDSLPKSEEYILKQQLWRAAISIPANIAEGCGRRTPADQRSFLYNSVGSAKEVEYYLILLRDLKCINEDHFHAYERKIDEIQKIIRGLINVIDKNSEHSIPDSKLKTPNS